MIVRSVLVTPFVLRVLPLRIEVLVGHLKRLEVPEKFADRTGAVMTYDLNCRAAAAQEVDRIDAVRDVVEIRGDHRHAAGDHRGLSLDDEVESLTQRGGGSRHENPPFKRVEMEYLGTFKANTQIFHFNSQNIINLP